MIKCELDYCIYNRDFFCLLKEIHLNMLGMCEECVIVSIPADILKELKESQFEKIDGR